ncbi:MAG: FtsX-like permease family protein [Pseudomonadota bacterium]
MSAWPNFSSVFSGDRQSDQIVPPSGLTARLTGFTAAAMAFLCVFALALSLATGRLAERWSTELSKTSTIRISAPETQLATQTDAVLRILKTTPGIASARLMSEEEQRQLLAPWFGPDLPLETLPIPNIVEIVEEEQGPDMQGLRLRLSAEAPGAVLDDHTRWRRPLVQAANRLRIIALGSIALIVGALAAMISLAAQASLSANANVIEVLRLVGAKDSYIAKAFVRRFTRRAFIGALIGVIAGMAAIFFLPEAAEEGAFLTGLGFQGWHWLIPAVIPIIAAFIGFAATRRAAFRNLNRTS